MDSNGPHSDFACAVHFSEAIMRIEFLPIAFFIALPKHQQML